MKPITVDSETTQVNLNFSRICRLFRRFIFSKFLTSRSPRLPDGVDVSIHKDDSQDKPLGDDLLLRSRRSTLSRLLRLENAVTWYGGGWDHLIQRAIKQAEEVRASDQRTARLLDDVVQYLQDIAIAGNLPVTNRRHDYLFSSKSRQK
ncbi:TPA: hypothetical protein JS309_004369 [Escherichia coli]|nr:hypothetical protein [Escherichia coli]